jgi:predicted RNA-binding protein with PUA-like domain
MAYWLFKSEPSDWSWEDQKKRGAKGMQWYGVRNYQARNNMQEMKVGDLGFFYHSVNEKRIVGIVKVIAEAHHVPNPVTLADIKAEPKLKDMVLVNNTRLSVQPVTPAEWKIVCKMCGVK